MLKINNIGGKTMSYNKKKFDGKWYTLKYSYGSKLKAIKSAQTLRQKGYLARVRTATDDLGYRIYDVFVRKK